MRQVGHLEEQEHNASILSPFSHRAISGAPTGFGEPPDVQWAYALKRTRSSEIALAAS